jgi:prepilin-type N-terminal cleavage/methylation domain-containing protein
MKTKKFFANQCQSGFTLLEIMIVLAIITGMIALIMPRIGNQNNQMKAAVRRMTVLSKQLQATARLQGASFRIAFDLKERPEDEQEYWIEKSNSSVLLPEDKNILVDEQNRKKREEEGDTQSPGDPSTEGFTPDNGILEGRQKLPNNLRFDSIEVVGLDRPIETGMAYIHYHAQGLVEEAAIHIKYGDKNNDGLEWTIAIHPLTGRADIITENVSLEEIRQQ